jgi:hypothetical protein
MPATTFRHLQPTIQDLIDLLKQRKPWPSFLRLGECKQEPIIRALMSWQKYAVDACTTRTLIAQAKDTVQRWKDVEHDDRFGGMGPESYEEEVRYWAASSLLLPPSAHLHRDLKKLLKSPLNNNRAQSLQDYIERERKPNVLLADMEHLAQTGHMAVAFYSPHCLCTMLFQLGILLRSYLTSFQGTD